MPRREFKYSGIVSLAASRSETRRAKGDVKAMRDGFAVSQLGGASGADHNPMQEVEGRRLIFGSC